MGLLQNGIKTLSPIHDKQNTEFHKKIHKQIKVEKTLKNL